MTSRKDRLKTMFVPLDATHNTLSAVPARPMSGAVKAMGLSLSGLAREVHEARAFQTAFEEGERVIELDPDLIDPSPFKDRLSDGSHFDEEFCELVESLKETGQHVPVLVRPHAHTHGRFQTAFGHRRIKAARQLGLKVKAVVRTLDDGALLLAQGQENAQRRNLSFIEKALFAKFMIDAGIDRAHVQAALSAHKAEMTRYLQVAEMIPLYIAQAIGPAPKIGRPRWMALGELIKKSNNSWKISDTMGGETFQTASSDDRFAMMYKRLAYFKVKSEKLPALSSSTEFLAQNIVECNGIPVTITYRENATEFQIENELFANFLRENLEQLTQAFAEQES
jgi:ParB family transcriptional regulator, chromosome partitioning protein